MASRGLLFLKSIQVRSTCEPIREASDLLLFVDLLLLALHGILEVLDPFA
jgi:hypothetical protein